MTATTETGGPAAPAGGAQGPLLEVRGLRTHFFTADGQVPAVDGVDLQISAGKTLGLVGESGCGKSVTALSIMRLIPSPPGRIVAGEVLFEGRNLLDLDESQMNRIRGGRISMIFQEPSTALNPLHTVGDQVAEAVMLHDGVSRREGVERAVAMLRQVGIPSPQQRFHSYPHELSGGMRQRAMIAMALACRPALLIADEPTTALDVTIQAQILDLLQGLQEEMGMALLLITHDLGVIAEVADEVAVMYAGRVVEQAPVERLFTAPRHPYTQGLLASIPTLETPRGERLNAIRGSVPSLTRLPAGCAFAPRCPEVMPVCWEQMPALLPMGEGQVARCWLYADPPSLGGQQIAGSSGAAVGTEEGAGAR
jgi:oligopeptide transport system ATP-binding protein